MAQMTSGWLGLPTEGEIVACGPYAYEWTVVEEIDATQERWGWELLCPIADVRDHQAHGDIPVVERLPEFN